MFSWFVGLGLASKIALGAGVAVAATTGAGAVGVLPGGAQDAFDNVVSVVTPWSDSEITSDEDVTSDDDATVTDDESTATDEEVTGDESSTFGTSVSERAKLLGEDGDGQQFGEEISGEAQQIGDSKRQNAGEPTTGDDATADDTTTDEDTAEQGAVGSTHKPEETPVDEGDRH